MAKYVQCPRCGNREDGASIWSCKDCGCVHCKECDPENGSCPNCGSRRVKCVGYVDDEDD